MWVRALCRNLTFWRAPVGGDGVWGGWDWCEAVHCGGVGGNANDRLRLSCQVSTSLTYIVLLTRGCSPWRPAAVMGTTWGESLHSSPEFSKAGQCSTGRCSRRSALRGRRGAYLQSSRFQANPPLYKEKTTLPGAPASVSLLHSFAALTA